MGDKVNAPVMESATEPMTMMGPVLDCCSSYTCELGTVVPVMDPLTTMAVAATTGFSRYFPLWPATTIDLQALKSITKSAKVPACTVNGPLTVSYTHLRAHETRHDLVC